MFDREMFADPHRNNERAQRGILTDSTTSSMSTTHSLHYNIVI